MINSKLSKLLGRGRKIVFSLALFLLVFAAASVVKIQAAGNVTGWLWGGSEDASIGGSLNTWPPDGNETGVGWISMNGGNYGVTIPDADGPVTGYAWANASDVPNSTASQEGNGLGWIQFDPAGGGVSVATTAGERRLSGMARIVSIANAGGNAGGWQGWIKMGGDGANWNGSSCVGKNNYNNKNQCNYGVKIDKSGNFSGYAWSEDLGWIDFSRAILKSCTNPSCSTHSLCVGDTLGSSCDPTSFCSGDKTATCTITGDTTWSCSSSCGTTVPCSAIVNPKVDGSCNAGTDGGSFCQLRTPTKADLCSAGTPNPGASSIDINSYQTDWQCQGSCGGSTASCSANGTKSCGWIETTP